MKLLTRTALSIGFATALTLGAAFTAGMDAAPVRNVTMAVADVALGPYAAVQSANLALPSTFQAPAVTDGGSIWDLIRYILCHYFDICRRA